MTYQEENKQQLQLFEPLRVADARDGSKHSPAVAHQGLRHCAHRTIPPLRRAAPLLVGDEYTQWSGWHYNNIAT